MRRYNIVACILFILSVFCFVLAAPVGVQEVCETCANTLGGGEDVKIGPGKRADTNTQEEPLSSSSSRRPLPWQLPDPGLSSVPSYATGSQSNPSHSSEAAQGQANLVQPGTSAETQAASSSKAKAKSVSWGWKETKLASGEMYRQRLPPFTKSPPPSPGTPSGQGYKSDDQPASPSEAKSVSPLPEMPAQQSSSSSQAYSKGYINELFSKMKFKFYR